MRWHDAAYGERHMPNVQINQSSMTAMAQRTSAARKQPMRIQAAGRAKLIVQPMPKRSGT